MRLAVLQFAPSFGEPEANLSKMEGILAGLEADLVVAPELALSGYLFGSREEVRRLSEPVPGPATERLAAALRPSGAHLVVGLAERCGEAVFNAAVLVGPRGVEGVYRKVHLFNEEKLYFAPGDGGFPLFRVREVPVGLLVCFDHMFPEAARTLALAGAQVICHPSNLVLPEYGQLTTRVRAIENRVFWALANRYGTEERAGSSLRFTGASQITGHDGKVLTRAPEAEDALLVVEIDPGRASDKRVAQHNDLLADRRPEFYRL
ncbi:MAG: nitrilase [Spirochaetales bacterium]|nr:nitrilase [Spirochaetales bacterium]